MAPSEHEAILIQEQGLGLASHRLVTDMRLRHEASSAREHGKDGIRVRMIAQDPDERMLGETTVFLADCATFEERQQQITSSVLPLLSLAEARPIKHVGAPPVPDMTSGVLGLAKAENESQRVVDWYRTHGGDSDDSGIQSLDILANPAPWVNFVISGSPDRLNKTKIWHWHGPATRAATARLRWEIANDRVRDRRDVDRWFVYYAWANWQEVPRSDAEALTDAYLRAYYVEEDENDPASPDLLLTYQIIPTCCMPRSTRWFGHRPIPTFRQRDFQRALARSEHLPTRRLALDEWEMLSAIWRRDVASPEEHGEALLRALSTSNSLSRILLHANTLDKRSWFNDDSETRLIKLIARSVWWDRVEWDSHSFFDERHKGNLHYGRSAARFHVALRDHLEKAPRPLDPNVRKAVELLWRTRKGMQFGLPEVIREEDGFGKPPSFTRPPPKTAEAPGSFTEWPSAWLPTPDPRNQPQGLPVLQWSTDGVFHQVHVVRERLRILWCDTRSGEWGESLDVAGTLANAVEMRGLRDCHWYSRHGHLYRVTPNMIRRVEADGSLTPHVDLRIPEKQWDMLHSLGDGLLIASKRSRLMYWDHATDSTIELANASSSRPGVLNNQRAWRIHAMHASPDNGDLDIVLSGSEPPPRGAGSRLVVRHVRLDPFTGEGTVVRSINPEGADFLGIGHSVPLPDFLLVQIRLSGRSRSTWSLWPRDPRQPIKPLPACDGATSVAISPSSGRLFASRPDRMNESSGLIVYTDVTADSPRHVTLRGVRFPNPELVRIGDDLAIMCSASNLRGGLLVIPEAFTRELPPEGMEIQLREE